MQYMRQLCFCKVLSILRNDIVVDGENTIDLTNICINEESSRTTADSKPGSPKSLGARESTPFTRSLSDIDKTQLEASRLLDILNKKTTCKESKVIPMPETWLNLRIKGSQHSQFLRRKCKHIPKGLFSCPAIVNETRYSMHWISEEHRNSWHALLDATGMVFGEDRLALAHHRPDFVVLCTLA